MRWILSLALLALLAVAPARAYTPEGGVWWNPAEPGIGFQFEIQDNLMFATFYVFDQDGFPMWYTATGFLEGNALFEADLDEFFGGTCVGCAYRENDYLGPAGTVRVQFDAADPTRATLTWRLDGGPQRSIPIERTLFYFQRAEDGSAPVELTKMLGEWNVTMDFSANPDAALAYYGDVLVFDQGVDLSESPGYFLGCRPESSVDGFCTQDSLDFFDAAGFYDADVDRQVIVVSDGQDQFGNPICVIYDVATGTNRFEGGLDDDRDPDDGGTTVYYCGQEDPFLVREWYPVRGHRTASRTFVEEGFGPNKAAVAAAEARASRLPLASSRVEGDNAKSDPARLARLRAAEAMLGITQR